MWIFFAWRRVWLVGGIVRLRTACEVLLLCSVWISTTAMADVEVQVDLYHMAGDLSPAQRDALLADPNWHIEADYAPRLSVPWITASWASCGLLSVPCLRDDRKTIKLRGAGIRREGTRIHFKLPGAVGPVGFFTLVDLRIQLAQLPFDSIHSLEGSFMMGARGGVKHGPVVLNGGRFVLAGSMKTSGTTFHPRDSCPDHDNCLGSDARGDFVFKPKHRFAFYLQPYQFSDLETPVLQHLPAELKGAKLYRATLRHQLIDGHRIEFVDISGRIERADCMSDRVEYKILYVDGEAISYARRAPDPDRAQCRGHYQSMDWDNRLRPLSHDRTLTDWINGGSSVTYWDWDVNCSVIRGGNYSRCNSPAPNEAVERDIRADARRVRAWFH